MSGPKIHTLDSWRKCAPPPPQLSGVTLKTPISVGENLVWATLIG